MLVAAFSMTSCAKDDDEEVVPAPAPLTKTDLLVGKYWTLTSHTGISSWSATPIDYYSSLKNCEKDDFILFTREKAVFFDEGDTKCNANDNQIAITGKWLLANREKMLILNTPYFNEEFEIMELTENKLVLKGISTVGGNATAETLTYAAQ